MKLLMLHYAPDNLVSGFFKALKCPLWYLAVKPFLGPMISNELLFIFYIFLGFEASYISVHKLTPLADIYTFKMTYLGKPTKNTTC